MRTDVNANGEIQQTHDNWELFRDQIIKRLKKIKTREEMNIWMVETFITILGNKAPEDRLLFMLKCNDKITRLERDFSE